MILVINSGSSSIKFKLYKKEPSQDNQTVLEGIAERITLDGILTIKYKDNRTTWNMDFQNHESAVKGILSKFQDLGVIKTIDEIVAIGFRIVNGGSITEPTIINDKVYKAIFDSIEFAPLHNPGALVAIDAFKKITPNAILVGNFDNAFHHTIPKSNFLYPLPIEWYKKYNVRKFGFHGLSYQYIVEKFAELAKENKENLNLVICHLGSGSSMACIQNGLSLDTTMGFTPLGGLMMGTRSGNIDPSILEFITKKLSMTISEVTEMLNKKSGLLGMSEISADMRDLILASAKGNDNAKLAVNKYEQTVADNIVTFVNRLPYVDAIIFTAGIGENSPENRQGIIDKIKILNVNLDQTANNEKNDSFKLISANSSAIPVYVIRTDEESMIYQNTLSFLK
ncbi:acetate/propionate family kinase [Mesoplasma syrphidae]|uniref:Acetate kinase n=1 Tax=Mesoplasma syrphidae TaxID=225999 RepID=A0A2K9BQF4_9MOLU|nr:acetate/propionate family kinase [Mesoplasma syrphidae]AUF83242.1 acetate/propionate family kinase [Mesoplasma syrphidae]